MSLADAMTAAVVQTIAVAYADDAVLTPAASAVPVDIRIVVGLRNPVIELGGFQTDLRAPGLHGRVARTDLTTAPVRGDTIQIITGPHAGTYTVRDVTDDLERSDWTLDLS